MDDSALPVLVLVGSAFKINAREVTTGGKATTSNLYDEYSARHVISTKKSLVLSKWADSP